MTVSIDRTLDLEYLGNFAEVLRDGYKDCEKYVEKHELFGAEGTHLAASCDPELAKILYGLEDSMNCPDCPSGSSWIAVSPTFFRWHLDWQPDSDSVTVISAYPQPTNFLLPVAGCEVPEELSWYPALSDSSAGRVLNSGKVRIFTPRPGDIYRFGAQVWHRTNPSTKGLHLVVRISRQAQPGSTRPKGDYFQ